MRLAFWRTEKRATLKDPSEELKQALVGSTSYSGKSVSAATSFELVAFFAAVRIRSSAVGSLPCKVYRDTTTFELATDTRQWEMLHEEPNPEMAADEYFQAISASLSTWGNAFVYKQRGGDGRVANLWPIDPSRVQVGRRNDRKFFKVDDAGPFFETDILHIRGMSLDGLVGLSPVQQAKQSLGNLMAIDEYQGRFWSNGARPGGLLVHPNKLSDDAADRLIASWNAAHAGVSNAAKVAVLEEGVEWQSLSLPLEDAQFIEQARFGDTKIAQLVGVPFHRLGAEIGSSLTYTTTEQASADYVTWELRPELVRIERSHQRDPEIFPPILDLTPKFDVDELLRADVQTRFAAHEIALRNRFKTRNDVRRDEGLPPLEGGDDFPDAPTGDTLNA